MVFLMETDFLKHVVKAPSQYDQMCRDLAAEVVRLREEREEIVKSFRLILETVHAWDDDGAIGPKPPLSYETAARMAWDYARAALVKVGR
jgi:hypothetical protein